MSSVLSLSLIWKLREQHNKYSRLVLWVCFVVIINNRFLKSREMQFYNFIIWFYWLSFFQVEVQIKRLFCVSKIKKTPITIEDPFSSEVGIKKALKVTSSFIFFFFVFHVDCKCFNYKMNLLNSDDLYILVVWAFCQWYSIFWVFFSYMLFVFVDHFKGTWKSMTTLC